MNAKTLVGLLVYAVIAGNFLFILWMTYNAIDENGKAKPVEIASAIGLTLLLLTNTFLLVWARRKGSYRF